MSNVWFRLMAVEFKIRDAINPREETDAEIGLEQGFTVLDFGCGPGGYVIPVSKAIGEKGKLYALDVMPVAISMVKDRVKRSNLSNVETILSPCDTGLETNSLDVVLLYDVYHDLEDKEGVLQELNRVLKKNGKLSFSDHHMKEPDIISAITKQDLFKLLKKDKHTFTFIKH